MRTRHACLFCKRRKIRCNGTTPCRNCLKHEVNCEYVDSIKNNLKIESQDEYIKHLERKISKLETAQTEDEYSTDTANDVFVTNSYAISNSRFGISTKHQSTLPRELALSMSKCLDPKLRESIPIPRTQYYGWNMSGGHYLSQKSLPEFKEIIHFNTDIELVKFLLDFFFQKLNPLYSFIDEQLFRKQFDKFISNYLLVSNKSSRLFVSILHLIFAITIRFAECDPDVNNAIKSKLIDQLEENLFTSAYDVVSILSFEWQSFELIQSWVLITFYLRLTHRQNSSYASLGVAIRMTKGMSLSVKANLQRFEVNSPESLKIQRIFWLVYTWDRIYSFQHGDEFEISNRSITLDMPYLEIHNTGIGVFDKPTLVMIQLAKISGQILDATLYNCKKDESFIRRTLENLKEVEEWCDQNLFASELDPLIIKQVYLTHHDIVLSFQMRYLFQLIGKEKLLIITNSLEILLQYSSKVIKLLQEIESLGQLHSPWPLNLSLLFTISLISVCFINSAIHFDQSCENLSQCLRLLESLKDKTKMANECIWALKVLNNICVMKSEKITQTLKFIGTDHGSNEVNSSNFLQFSKAGDHDFDDQNELPDLDTDLLVDHLKWFDELLENMHSN